MALVVFTWQKPRYQLQLLQFKQDREKNASWWVEEEETKHILGVRNDNTGGTLLGCTKKGRVAFLVHGDSLALSLGNGTAELLPVKFLKGEMSPIDFAEQLLISDKKLSSGLTFFLVVADIASKSMIYISKRSPSNEIEEIRQVDPGFHFIASTGLDSTSPQDQLLKDKFSPIFAAYGDTRVYPLFMLKNKFYYFQVNGEEGEEEYYGATLLEVDDAEKIRFLKNEGQKDHEVSLDFNMESNEP